MGTASADDSARRAGDPTQPHGVARGATLDLRPMRRRAAMLDGNPLRVEVATRSTPEGLVRWDAVRLPDGPGPAAWRAGEGDPLEGAGGRGAVFRVATPAGPAVRRHYRRGGLVARLLGDRYLWTGAERTRAFREFAVTRILQRAGLPVPTPLAARVRRGGLFYRADLLVSEIPGTRTLASLRDGADIARFEWDALGSLIARFHRAGLWHADLNAHNVLIDAQGGLWLIDFDRAELDPPARARHRANLERLLRSLRKLGFDRAVDDFARSVEAPLRRGYAAAQEPAAGEDAAA